MKAAQGTSNVTSVGNRIRESKSKTIAKGRELNVSSKIPAHGNPALQSSAPTSVPGDLATENNFSSAIPAKVAPVFLQGTSGATDAGSHAIHNQVGAASAGTEAVIPAASSGSAVVPVPVPSIESPGAVIGGSGRSGTGETFTALDAEGTNRVTWVHAGAQQAEAGYQDPSLGWVSVRADVSGGAIRASLIPATADAAQVIGGHLEGLNSYLSAHHSGVETITLAAPSGRTNEFADSEASGRGMEQGSGRGASHESGQSEQDGHGGSGNFAANGRSNADSEVGGTSEVSMRTRDGEQQRAMQPFATGGRISVIA